MKMSTVKKTAFKIRKLPELKPRFIVMAKKLRDGVADKLPLWQRECFKNGERDMAVKDFWERFKGGDWLIEVKQCKGLKNEKPMRWTVVGSDELTPTAVYYKHGKPVGKV